LFVGLVLLLGQTRERLIISGNPSLWIQYEYGRNAEGIIETTTVP